MLTRHSYIVTSTAAKAVHADVTAGTRRLIIPSRKARAAAGILSDEPDSSDTDIPTTSKRKAPSKISATKKKKILKLQPQAKETIIEDTEIEDGGGDTEEDGQGDQADEYERLREQREHDRPVCVYFLCLCRLFEADKNFSFS